MNVKEKDLSRYCLNELEERLFNKSLDNKRHNHLWQYVVDDMNIMCAIKIVKSNKGSDTPGPDNKTIKMVMSEDINTVIKEIKSRLFGYVKGKARKAEIKKEDGKMRPLGIANIYDRISQQCIKNVLEPIVESHFNQESFGFRRNRNAQECISYIATSIQFNEDGHIYDCDLKSYFDMVEIDLVIDKLKKNHNIHDLQFLKAIKSLMWIDLVNPKVKYNGTGLRQGTILGPILANVMFHDFELKLNEINDHKRKNGRDLISNPNIFKNFGKNYKRGKEFYFNWLQERRVVKMVRYADDFVLISKGKYDIYDAIMLFEDWCINNKLEINKEKTKLIRLTQDVKLNFVGYKLSKSSKKRHTFVIAPKNQKKIWYETKKRLKWSIYKKKYDYILVYLRGIFQYYDVCTNMTWLINRTYLYLIALARRKRRYGHRIEMKHGENVYFLLDGVRFDLWELRKYSVKSTKSYMLEVNKLWYPNKETMGSKEWISEYMRNKTHCGRNSTNIIYVPSLINQYKKEPITGKDFYWIRPSDIVIHHKIPLSIGGSDEYSNLILLREDCHKLVHKVNLTREEVPDYVKIKVLNKYRVLCGLNKV